MCIYIYVTSYLSNSIPAGDLYILGHSLPVSLLATFGVISYVYNACIGFIRAFHLRNVGTIHAYLIKNVCALIILFVCSLIRQKRHS